MHERHRTAERINFGHLTDHESDAGSTACRLVIIAPLVGAGRVGCDLHTLKSRAVPGASTEDRHADRALQGSEEAFYKSRMVQGGQTFRECAESPRRLEPLGADRGSDMGCENLGLTRHDRLRQR